MWGIRRITLARNYQNRQQDILLPIYRQEESVHEIEEFVRVTGFQRDDVNLLGSTWRRDTPIVRHMDTMTTANLRRLASRPNA